MTRRDPGTFRLKPGRKPRLVKSGGALWCYDFPMTVSGGHCWRPSRGAPGIDPEVLDALLEICQREYCDLDELVEEASALTPDAPLDLALCLFAIGYFRPAAGDPVDDAASETKPLC